MKGRKDFFFEKKKQKTFIILEPRWLNRRVQTNKSFLVLFFKKEHSSFSIPQARE
jgi:hypothetical protein